MALVTALLGLTIGLQLAVMRSFSLFTRFFWLDEIYTHTLVTDPSVGHAMRALAAGVETHPPTYYLLASGFAWMVGNGNEGTLRALAFLSMVIGLLGLYRALRLTFTPLVAFAAVLAVWCHPLVQTHAFEARFYSPWFAGIVWFAYFLVRSRWMPRSAFVNGMVALCAIFICTVHYFGVISLGLVLAAELVARRWENLSLLPGMPAAALGLAAAAACVPMLLRQRSAITVSTWVGPVNWEIVRGFLEEIYVHRYMLLLLAVAWATGVVYSLWMGRGRRAAGVHDLGRQAGLLALGLMPVLLVAFSYAIQSVLITRYCLPAVAALGPACAYLIARCPRVVLLAFCGALVVMSALELRAMTVKFDADQRQTLRVISEIREVPDDLLVVFESPAQLYVVCRYGGPDVTRRSCLLDFERLPVRKKTDEPYEIRNVTDSRVFVRDLSRKYAEYYGTPAVKKWSELKKLGHFYLVPKFFAGGAYGVPWDVPYPGFYVTRRTPDLSEVTPKDGG
jgi:hypothetical protein